MPHLYRVLPWFRTWCPAGGEFCTQAPPGTLLRVWINGPLPPLAPPTPAVTDTAKVRLGDGFISAEFPPMRREG